MQISLRLLLRQQGKSLFRNEVRISEIFVRIRSELCSDKYFAKAFSNSCIQQKAACLTLIRTFHEKLRASSTILAKQGKKVAFKGTVVLCYFFSWHNHRHRISFHLPLESDSWKRFFCSLNNSQRFCKLFFSPVIFILMILAVGINYVNRSFQMSPFFPFKYIFFLCTFFVRPEEKKKAIFISFFSFFESSQKQTKVMKLIIKSLS